MTPKSDSGFVEFWKKVGIVGSGVMVAFAILSALILFAWRTGTAPIVAAIADERTSRAAVDSAIVDRLETVNDDVVLIAQALSFPVGSSTRDALLSQLANRAESRNRRRSR